jgi:hypothetical protein
MKTKSHNHTQPNKPLHCLIRHVRTRAQFRTRTRGANVRRLKKGTITSMVASANAELLFAGTNASVQCFGIEVRAPAHMRARTHAHAHARSTHTHTHSLTHSLTHAHTLTHTHLHTHTHTHTCARSSTHAHTHSAGVGGDGAEGRAAFSALPQVSRDGARSIRWSHARAHIHAHIRARAHARAHAQAAAL